MFNTRFDISAWKGSVIKMAAVFALCVGEILANKMASDIQEAIYLFEMKGEVNESVRILKKVSVQGDKEDQQEANFFLGKIYELSGDNNNANSYYRKSLHDTKETGKSYWLAEREAATSSTPEKLLKNNLHVRYPIKKIFYGNPTHILLNNNSIYKIENDTLVEIKIPLPIDVQILDIIPQGIWYQTKEKDSLFFRPMHPKNPQISLPIEATTSVFSRSNDGIALSGHTLTLFNRKGIKAVINERYNNCKIEGFYGVTSHYILNCPDNALHFISSVDGAETYNISQYDAIPQVLIIKKNIFVISGNTLFCYQPKVSTSPLWKIQFSNIDEISAFENNIVILEASGKVSLVNVNKGSIISTVRSDASSIAPLSQGTLGLFSNEGTLNVVDTLMHPLWHFNFSKPLLYKPIQTGGNLYLTFDDFHFQGISSNYYGIRPLLSNKYVYKAAALTEEKQWEELAPTLDTLFNLEPGNAEGWFFKALLLENNESNEKERQKAWAEAVRLSASNPQVTSLILTRYSNAIGAKFVSLLKISPKTRYPQFFGNKKNLYTIDPAAEKLLCINPENGELRWSRNLNKMDNSPVFASDEDILTLASGFNLSIYDLSRDAAASKVQLPGKAFNIAIEKDHIYVSTWNGFLLKYNKENNNLIWSRKVYGGPFIFAKKGDIIHLSSLEGGTINIGDGSGQIKENGPRIPGTVSQLVASDSALAITTNSSRLYIFNRIQSDKDPIQILLESQVASMQSIQSHGSNYLLIGLANQAIVLYNEAGAPLWKYQGRNSIFTQPVVFEDVVWIDQGNEVVGLSLKDGSIVKKMSTPGGAGTPYITGRTLFSASPKRFLYGFSL